MKKSLNIILITSLLIASFSQFAYGKTPFENPKDIIITQPGMEYSTGSQNVSILGASDWEYPIYMNGKKINTTEHGFFTEYVSLVSGVNSFVFKNNNISKTVKITYKAKSPAGVSEGDDTGTFNPYKYLYLKGSDPMVGVVKVNNATRAKDNREGKDLMVPLAKGTKVKIIGQDSNFYMLSDYSFAYKSSFTAFGGEVSDNFVTGISVNDNKEFNSAEVSLTMNVNPLYDYSFDGNRFLLTLYGTANVAKISLNDNKLVSKITPVVSQSAGACTYEILLNKGNLTNGTYLEFSDGKMILGFKKVPLVSNGDLSNVRIFLDAGHGGTDPGAMGPLKNFGPVEKDINLEISKYTYKYLTSKGANIIATRMDDSSVSLAERMELVTTNKPDLSISIHSNATAVTNNYNNAKGYRTYYTYTLPVTGPEDAVSFISRRAAELAGVSFEGKNKSNLALGRNLYCPSIVFEAAFMSNPSDYEWLLIDGNQKKMGEAIGQATVEWFETLNAMPAYDQSSIKVFVKGEKLAFDVEPFIESGRTLVPIRKIFEALGAEVIWNEAAQTATVSKEGISLSFKINDSNATLNGENKIMEVPAKIVEGGRTVVPLRFLSEALGYQVDWNGDTQTINISGR